MFVLVDFENVPLAKQHKGVAYLVDRIARCIDGTTLCVQKRLSFRMYGGWYQEREFTRKAQALAIEIEDSFPSVLEILEKGSREKIPVSVELAYSLAIAPNMHLFATYRPRFAPTSLKCRHPSELGCSDFDCPMISVHGFFSQRKCPRSGCAKRYEDFLFKGQQKLVDAMLVSDLLHFSHTGERHVAVVSSDDDFWPGIIAALYSLTSITHICTRRSGHNPDYYADGLPPDYRRISL